MTTTPGTHAMGAPASALGRAARSLARRAEFGDAVLFVYLAAFARQYFWPVGHGGAAWVLTFAAAALAWALYVRAKPAAGERTPREFWLVVGLPLLAAYALRAAVPDTSFDVLNYRLVGAERALGGWPFIEGDFFPPFYPLNPAPDMIQGIWRRLLGYRLGTVSNLLVMLWAGAVVERLLRPYVSGRWLRSLAVLAVLWFEHALFLVNNYMVDVLALPLLLEATRLALGDDGGGARGGGVGRAGDESQPGRGEVARREGGEADTRDGGVGARREGGEGASVAGREDVGGVGREGRRLARMGLLAGMAVALKVLNLAYLIPVGLVYVLSAAGRRRHVLNARLAPWALGAVALFALPLAPYTLYIYALTGNPVFPLFNAVFESPLWGPSNLYDGRWGPRTIQETLLWPLRVAFDASRTGELAVYAGRLSLVCVAAGVALAARPRDRRLLAISLATLAGALLWAAALTGYARYANYPEALGGVTIICLAASLWTAARRDGGDDDVAAPSSHAAGARPLRRVGRALALVLLVALAAQCLYSAKLLARYEWAMRPTVFNDYQRHAAEARHLLRDRSIARFLSAEERGQFAGVGAWIESGLLTSGVESLLVADAPILCAYVHDYFYSEEGRRMFSEALARSRGRRVASLCLRNDLEVCRRHMSARGLEVTSAVPVKVPVYSHRTRLDMLLLEVRPPE